MDIVGPLTIATGVSLGSQWGSRVSENTRRDLARALIVFVVTAAWDIVLRFVALGQAPLVGTERWGWVRDLRGYFETVGVWRAAGAAGATGVMGYAIIRLFTPRGWIAYTTWVFTASALVGIPMRFGNWFADLQENYYDKRKWLTFATDGLSGVIVLATIIVASVVARAGME